MRTHALFVYFGFPDLFLRLLGLLLILPRGAGLSVSNSPLLGQPVAPDAQLHAKIGTGEDELPWSNKRRVDTTP
jgi:hypothetical protein